MSNSRTEGWWQYHRYVNPAPVSKPVIYFHVDLPSSAWVNLKKATKLEDVTLKCWTCPRWSLATLQDAVRDRRELQWITLNARPLLDLGGPEGIADTIREAAYQGWLELDRFLAQLCELSSIRLTVLYNTT